MDFVHGRFVVFRTSECDWYDDGEVRDRKNDSESVHGNRGFLDDIDTTRGVKMEQ